MTPKATAKQTTPELILNALASRVGIVLSIGMLISVCLSGGIYIHTAVSQWEENQAIFEDRQVRNGYVAINDLQRIVQILQNAVEKGQMTPEMAEEFANATDILFVRADHFRSRIRSTEGMASGEAAIKSLDEIVTFADSLASTGFPDLKASLNSLVEKTSQSRKLLVMFLDDMRRSSENLLIKQSTAVRNQQVFVLASLVGLTIVGSVALFFLRREVLGRQARALAEKRVAFLAFFDPLTELPNRVQFQDRFKDILDDGGEAALLYVDLDGFKGINDTQGHAAGDAVLQRVGQLLELHALRYDGFAARLGGDEFAIVVPTCDIDTLAKLCELLIDQADDPFDFEGENIEISLSIGVSTTLQAHAAQDATVDGMSRVTDFALYASKTSGRKRFTIYDKVLEQRLNERRAMLKELPEAIENGNLSIYLQPKVELRDNRVFGFEALVRWQRGDELIAPDSFIRLAEESGLVIDIDKFVLGQATRTVAQWNDQNGTDFSVSVNLSALHFNSAKIVTSVDHALWRSDLRPDLLTLEITETLEMRDWGQAQKTIKHLHRLGCKIAIDDFGTGFSSLAYLRSTLADELKIDRSLVDELETSKKARLLLSSVFDIAGNLELEVIVEGIETTAQVRILREMGATHAQGFLFGAPMPAEIALEHATRATRAAQSA